MTAKEMEVAYCKARITCIKSFRLLLREHIKMSEEGLNLKLSYEQVHKIMMAGLENVNEELTKELEKWERMLSETTSSDDEAVAIDEKKD